MSEPTSADDWTVDQIAADLVVGRKKIQQAIRELQLVPTPTPRDRRVRLYSQDDIARIRVWLNERRMEEWLRDRQ